MHVGHNTIHHTDQGTTGSLKKPVQAVLERPMYWRIGTVLGDNSHSAGHNFVLDPSDGSASLPLDACCLPLEEKEYSM